MWVAFLDLHKDFASASTILCAPNMDDAAPAKYPPVLLLQADSWKHPVSLRHSGAHGDGQLQALILILPEKVTESTNSC